MSAVRVLVADEQTLVRQGIVGLLRQCGRFATVDEASDGEEALLKVKEFRPDVALLDARLPGIDGLQAAEIISKEFPSTSVVLLASSVNAVELVAALKAGARGYVLKKIDLDELVEIIGIVARGQCVLCPRGVAGLLRQIITLASHNTVEPSKEQAREDSLTDREKDILSLLGRGLSNKEIARELVLAEGTVKAHLHNIFRKLDLSSRFEASVYATRRGNFGSEPRGLQILK